MPIDIALAPDDMIYTMCRGYEHPAGTNRTTKIRVISLGDDGEEYIDQFTGDSGLSKWGVEKIKDSPDFIRQRNGVQGLTEEKVMWAPMAVKFDDNRRRLIVVDTSRHRLQVYQKITESVNTNAATLTLEGAWTGSLA